MEPSSYYEGQVIRVSEAELIMLREFKNQRLNDLNEEVKTCQIRLIIGILRKETKNES